MANGANGRKARVVVVEGQLHAGSAEVLDAGWKMETLTVDQQNYKDYVADRVAHGWSAADVAEYKEAVGDLMSTGTEDDKAAAREFWQLMAIERRYGSAAGINARIRRSIEQGRRMAA